LAGKQNGIGQADIADSYDNDLHEWILDTEVGPPGGPLPLLSRCVH
jgi:hypothetical protein